MTDYYHTDHVGSTTLLTDESGTVITDVTYGPFGVPTDTQEHYLYTGKQNDSTGLYYYGARYYDPMLGRFLTRDVARENYNIPQSLNRYSYCRNNPQSYIDPDGKMEKKITIDGGRSPHPYRVYTINPPKNVYGVLLLSIPITSEKSLVRVEGSLIKFYDTNNAGSAEGNTLGWSNNIAVITLQIECNEAMLEANISLTSDGEFEFVNLIEKENEQIIEISVKIYPKSDGEVVFEFSFEVWAPGEEVEIKVTLWPNTAAHLPLPELAPEHKIEKWEVTVPVGDGPIVI